MVWIVKKGISCLLILLGVTFVTFALMYLAGGDAISYFYENQGTAVSQEIMDAMRKNMGWTSRFSCSMGIGSCMRSREIWGKAMCLGARCFRSLHPGSRIPCTSQRYRSH